MSLNTLKITSYRELREPSLQAAVLGSDELLNTLRKNGMDIEQLRRIERVLDLMFELHKGQLRPDDAPYQNHSLLVARILVKKFEIGTPAAVVASLLHDAPEDQARKINFLFGGVDSSDCGLACRLLSEQMFADTKEVLEYLRGLTNPDFKRMVEVLKGRGEHDQALLSQAKVLLHEVSLSGLYSVDSFKNLGGIQDAEVKMKLYLGHWCELLKGNRITLAIKLADFYTNGLHRHLLLNQMQLLDEKDPMHAKLSALNNKFSLKYGPLLRLIEKSLNEADKSGIALVSAKGDKLLKSKLKLVSEYY